jgi:nitrite reductase/ring-hydroxylating ferredoxin subunit
MTDHAEVAARPKSAPLIDTRQRGTPVEFRKEGEFHECWYPIALSADVAVGAVIGLQFLDGRVVVYRTSDGKAHAQSAYCRHMGADLSIGKVVDDKLQCPFHFWRYDGTGSCVEIPAGDAPPQNAKLFTYPVEESLGIIWAFNGEVPSYPVPRFDVDEGELVFDTFRNPLPMAVESSFVFLNGFDLQHFKVVHNMPTEVDQNAMRQEGLTLSYDARISTPEFGDIVQKRKLWGVSTLTVETMSNGRKIYLLHGLCPVSPDMTHGFLVNATPATPGEADDTAVRANLAKSREYSLRLVNEDAPILSTIRFRRDCLTASDRFLAYGMQYISRYPRAHPGRSMIR